MIIIARVDFDGLRVAIDNTMSVRTFNEQYIGYQVSPLDILDDMAKTGDDEDVVMERQRKLQWLTASEFQLLKAFFHQKKELVTYDNFRKSVLPEIRGMADPFYRDQDTIKKIVTQHDWKSHNHTLTFNDITDEYINEALLKFNWHKIEMLPTKGLETVIPYLPSKDSWESIWGHSAVRDVFSATQTESRPIYKSGEIVEYEDVPKKIGEKSVYTGAYAVICTNKDGTRDLHIF